MSEERNQNQPAMQGGHPNPSKEVRPALPLLIEFSLSLTKTLVVLIAALVAAVSLVAGASIQVAALRSGLALLCLGWLLWLLNWVIARGSLEAVMAEMREKLNEAQADHPASTTEKAA